MFLTESSSLQKILETKIPPLVFSLFNYVMRKANNGRFLSVCRAHSIVLLLTRTIQFIVEFTLHRKILVVVKARDKGNHRLLGFVKALGGIEYTLGHANGKDSFNGAKYERIVFARGPRLNI